MLNQLHVNIQFIDALYQMFLHAKFFKQIISNKRKIDEYGSIVIGEECSVVVLSKLLTKCKDLGSFSIHCLIENVSIDNVLCDLG